jgi:hypothetical protein
VFPATLPLCSRLFQIQDGKITEVYRSVGDLMDEKKKVEMQPAKKQYKRHQIRIALPCAK